MAFFGLKLDLDLEMRAAHPHQKFQGVPPGVARFGGKSGASWVNVLPKYEQCLDQN